MKQEIICLTMILKDYKNIFLDRDGVINSVVKRGKVISSPRSYKEFRLKKDFIDFSCSVGDCNKNYFICSNQPDIARGLLKEDELKKMHLKITKYLPFKEISFCPHDDDDNCNCRKPRPGMINNLIKKYNLKKEDCLFIGDSKKDILAAKQAKIDAYLINTEYNMDIKYTYKVNYLTDLL